MRILRGYTILETVIGMAIFAFVSSGVYFAYSNVLDIINASQYHAAAVNIIEGKVEMVRNMRYEDIGTVNGAPAGKLPAEETVTLDGTPFLLRTTVRNIDDPYDGTVGGTPNDTAPADYKMVQFEVLCSSCRRFNLGPMTTIVGPKNLETAGGSGSLFIRVLDALGNPIPNASLSITNKSVTPNILLTDTTNASGELQLVGIATSAAGYHVTATKSGYTSDATWPLGDASNPNPTNLDATVAKESLTIATLQIDRKNTLQLSARDQFCQAVPAVHALLTGTTLIGHTPDIPRTNTAIVTGADGNATATAAWDSFHLRDADTAYDILARSSPLDFSLQPGDTYATTWIVASASASTLLVHVNDLAGAAIQGAAITLFGTGYTAQATTGQLATGDTDWAIGSVSSYTNNIAFGPTVALAATGGVYATGSWEQVDSRTFDFGTGNTLMSISAAPASQSANTTAYLQIAANDDNATWNYVGPDGTAGTYFTPNSTTIPSTLGAKRYVRYRILLRTEVPNATPGIDDVSIGYRPGCLPTGQAALTGAPGGTLSLLVSASGMSPVTASVSLTQSWQETTVVLQP